jgi:hypothetical protein
MKRRLLVGAIVAAAVWLSSNPSLAQGDSQGKGPCVRACNRDGRDCRQAGRRAFRECLQLCAPLRDAAAAACPDDDAGGDEGTVERSPECQAAIDALRACILPCFEAHRIARGQCNVERKACFRNQCGILPSPRPTDAPEAPTPAP